jgi:hypothetical protein
MGSSPKFILLAALLLLFGAGRTSVAYQACTTDPQIGNIQQVTSALQDATRPDFSHTDIPAFCKKNSKEGVSDAMTGWDDKMYQEGITKDYGPENQNYKDMIGMIPKKPVTEVWYLAGDRWLASTYPDLRTRLLNHFNNQGIGKAPVIVPAEQLALLPASDHYPWQSKQKAAQAIAKQNAEMKKPIDQESDVQTGMMAKAFMCKNYASGHTGKCIDALTNIVDVMHPVKSINLWGTVKTVMADPSYIKAAQILALKIEKKVESPGTPTSDLYTDTVASFLKIGETPANAEEKAFNLLAVYSTHGPNSATFLENFLTKENSPLYHALTVIGTGITVLNSRTIASGHQYSYPPGVQGGCDNAKPYHFWMTAFLARKGAKETGDADAARGAAFISHLGYQMLSETYGRDPKQVFTHKCYDASNNKIRMDVSFAAAGATFGANSVTNQKTNVDVDEGLRKMLSSSQCPGVLTSEESEAKWSGLMSGYGLAGFNRWSDTFAPQDVFQALK